MSFQQDARKSPRKTMLAAGKIIFNNKQSVFDCTVKNLSAGGARLRLPNLLGLPNNFELQIKKYGVTYPCDVVWRGGDQMGVQFDRLPD